jgi:mannose-1-phosphate guanylyltransferase/mannose-6-phosphate isomerase
MAHPPDERVDHMSHVYPLILCGGVGTRLWPLSRTANPKQFQRIDGNSALTFFHATVERQRDAGFGQLLVSVSRTHVSTVVRQLDELGCMADIIAEPVARNTGPAVLAAALRLLETDPDAMLCVLPSDHVIRGDLVAEIRNSIAAAERGHIVLFGVTPEYPETGYGYIVDAGPMVDLEGARRVSHFVEKPPLAQAVSLIAEGAAYWASGMSLFKASVLVDEFMRLDPVTYHAVARSLHLGTRGDQIIHLDAESFALSTNLPTESIIFEKSERIVLARLGLAWSDVGAWSALHYIGEKDGAGNVVSGDVIAVGMTNSYIRSSGKLIAVVGMDDVVVVDTDDALLVTTRAKSQDVKQVVKQLESLNRPELAAHVRSQMEWGEVRHVQRGPGYELRVVTLHPGRAFNFVEDGRFHRMVTIAEGSGLYRSANQTVVVGTGDFLEIPPGESGILYSDHASMTRLVEVVCEDLSTAVRPLPEPSIQLVKG